MASTPQPVPPPSGTAAISGEEYRLYYESTEKVIDRRLGLNAWNYGICIAILVASGFLASWATTRNEFRLLLLIGVVLIAGMGFILCMYWVRQLSDYKLLNNIKFEVLNDMAPLVKFDDGGVSYEPFYKEWNKLKAREGTVKLRGMKIPVLRSSNAELIVPRAFQLLFASIVMAVVLVFVANKQVFLKDIAGMPTTQSSHTSTAAGEPAK
jgi:hypothetical protein